MQWLALVDCQAWASLTRGSTSSSLLWVWFGLVWFGLVCFGFGLVRWAGLGWAGLGWVGRDKRERRVETGFDDRDLTAACVRATV